MLREWWRSLRGERLKLKAEFEFRGFTKQDIHRYKNYRRLKKEQMHQSKIIKHAEKKQIMEG